MPHELLNGYELSKDFVLPLAIFIGVLSLVILGYILIKVSVSREDILCILYNNELEKTGARTALEILQELKVRPKRFYQVRFLEGVQNRLRNMEEDLLIVSDGRIVSETEVEVEAHRMKKNPLAKTPPPEEYRLLNKGRDMAKRFLPKA